MLGKAAKQNIALLLAVLLLLSVGCCAFADNGSDSAEPVFFCDTVYAVREEDAYDDSWQAAAAVSCGTGAAQFAFQGSEGLAELTEQMADLSSDTAAVRNAVRNAGVVVIATGMEDMLDALYPSMASLRAGSSADWTADVDAAAQTCAEKLRAFIGELRTEDSGVQILLLGAYDPFPEEGFTACFSGAAAQAAERMNEAIADTAEETGCEVLELPAFGSVYACPEIATGTDTAEDILFAAAPSADGQQILGKAVGEEIVRLMEQEQAEPAELSLSGSLNGNQLQVTCSIANNHGFAASDFRLVYDSSAMNLLQIENEGLAGTVTTDPENGIVISDGETGFRSGTLFTAWFAVTDAERAGEVGLTCTLRNADGEQLPVAQAEAMPVSCAENMGAGSGGAYEIQLDLTGIDAVDSAMLDGTPCSVQVCDDTVGLLSTPLEDCRTLVLYTYNTDAADENLRYPTAMYVWSLTFENGTYRAERLPELDNALQYAGISVSAGDSLSLRLVSAIPAELRRELLSVGVCGMTLREYGTVAAWESGPDGAELTLETAAAVGKAYETGKMDAVFSGDDSLIRFTNTVDNITAAEAGNTLVFRPYMILETADGRQVTLYGGTVARSVGYLAWRNRSAYPAGSAEAMLLQTLTDCAFPEGNPYAS